MAMRIIEQQNICVSDLVAGYINDTDTGQVTTMNGRLDVRPAYQREFVWDKGSESGGKKQEDLIDSILNGYPINVMYWVRIGTNQAGEDMYEVLDGQQRIITMCKFYQNEISVPENGARTTFDGLIDNSKFLDYDKMIVYICEGTLEEKLAWFERINTAGEPLKKQEMRSAIACGVGTTKAKKFFVHKNQSGTVAYSFDAQNGKPARDYVSGEWDRQAIYEKAITWKIDSKNNEDILAYMKNNRYDVTAANELFDYFKNVIRWVKRLFPTYNKHMSKVDWGFLYNRYKHNTTLSSAVLEREVAALMADDEVQKKDAVYEYVLDKANGIESSRLLNLRAFTQSEKTSAYARQRGVCPHCLKKWRFDEMAGDHIKPWSKGGKTNPENLQMLCVKCNNDKSNLPFDLDREKEQLQYILNLSEDEVKILPIGITE